MDLLEYGDRVVTAHVAADLDEAADGVQITVSALPQVQDLVGGRWFGGEIGQIAVHVEMGREHAPVVALLSGRIETFAELLLG